MSSTILPLFLFRHSVHVHVLLAFMLCAFKQPFRARLDLLSTSNFDAAAAQETGFTY